ncbi:YjgN family protein [Acidimicrobiales bacterium]|nr:YjgN family protein [Acidimicrobiales bacterium]
MSEIAQGPGWWQASDGQWYPPEDSTPEATVPSPVAPTVEARRTDVPSFYFDGGAATYFGTGLLAFLVTVLTLGIAFPFALVLRERWKAKHTYIEGRRLMFTGTGMGLFGNWIKWLLLMTVTFGIYTFWVIPRITKWKVERQAFDPSHAIGS